MSPIWIMLLYTSQLIIPSVVLHVFTPTFYIIVEVFVYKADFSMTPSATNEFSKCINLFPKGTNVINLLEEVAFTFVSEFKNCVEMKGGNKMRFHHTPLTEQLKGSLLGVTVRPTHGQRCGCRPFGKLYRVQFDAGVTY